MTASPIARCAMCRKGLYSPDEFLILVPPSTKGDLDIGGFDAFCERCYCAMGVSGGRKRWNAAMHKPRHGRWVHDGTTVHENPFAAAMWNGWHFEEGETAELFPDDVSLTYFDRKSVTLMVFNKLGRCVICAA
jgi:hypothetical protein